MIRRIASGLHRAYRAIPLLALLFGLVASAHAQQRHTEHTLKLDDSEARPEARLEQIAWLVGTWEGEAFGGHAEETWSPASAGTMVGTFKLTQDDRPTMYEFMLVTEEEGSLTLKLKHFNADFTGWEAKDDFVSFPLVRITEDAVYFDGLTYRQRGPDEVVVHLALRQKEEVQEVELLYRRSGGS